MLDTDYNILSDNDNTSIGFRKLCDRAIIPFYIMFDPSLRMIHFQIYAVIENCENNVNPDHKKSFSIAGFAFLSRADLCDCIDACELMKEKNYIKEEKLSNGDSVWMTVRKPLGSEYNDQ